MSVFALVAGNDDAVCLFCKDLDHDADGAGFDGWMVHRPDEPAVGSLLLLQGSLHADSEGGKHVGRLDIAHQNVILDAGCFERIDNHLGKRDAVIGGVHFRHSEATAFSGGGDDGDDFHIQDLRISSLNSSISSSRRSTLLSKMSYQYSGFHCSRISS